MNKTRKLASLLLALVMVLGMVGSAMAAYTITAPANGHTYEVYQIFTGDLDNGVLSNVKWGKNGTGAEGTPVAADILTALTSVNTNPSNTEKLAVITQYVNLKSTAYATTATGAITGVPAGYYLIKDLDGSLADNAHDAYTTYIVEVVDDVTITPKTGVPTVDKDIIENGTNVDENEASIGDKITYEWEATLPTNIADYNTYYYVFTDTMDKGLTLTTDPYDVTVELEQGDKKIDVTKYFYIGSEPGENGSTKLIVGIEDLLALKNLGDVADITASDKIYVTYTATLNDEAVVGTTGNKNKVDLEFSNNPNESGDGTPNTPPETPPKPEPEDPTGKTPESVVETFTTEIIIDKVDQSGKKLVGAEFTISGEGVNVVVVTRTVYNESTAGTYYKLKDGTYTTTPPTTGENGNEAAYESPTKLYEPEVVVETKTGDSTKSSVSAYVDENGTVKFTGLGAGTYTITETVTPAGYNTIAPLSVTITWSEEGTDCTWTYQWSDGKTGNHVQIVNQKGSTLPETGGIGTTLFYIAGSILVVGAFVLMITKRRVTEK